MNKCIICKEETDNKKYCSLNCRDRGRHDQSYETRVCKWCGKEFETRKKRKKMYCSNKCSSLATNDKRMKTTVKNNLKKYGVKYNWQRGDVKEKVKKNNLKKYGVEYNWQRNDVKEKIRHTNLEKYGVEYAQQSKEIRKKTRKSVNERYGGFTMESPELRKKTKKTLLKKYGVDNVAKNKSIREKVKKTNIEKYGYEYGLQNDEVKRKIKETNLKKYGKDNPLKVNTIKNKVKIKLMLNFMDKIFNGNRLKNKVIPLFSIDEYSGFIKEYKFQCKKCNGIFYDNFYAGKIPRCLKCTPLNQSVSFMEKEIVDYIKSIYDGQVIENDRKILNGVELDIYIPDKKIAIEFDGLYWHSEISGNKNKNYHLNKTIDCEKQGIHLIQLFEDEWLNKQDIVKSRLKNILSLNGNNRLFAKNCNVKSISAKEKNNFLYQYHIQGEDKSKIKLGLFNDTELIAVMTFGERRIALGSKKNENEYELIRFATSRSVVGGAGKLFSYFVKNYNPKKIISYADRRWTYHRNNLYDKIGFNKISEGFPNYWYIKNGNRIHRFNFRKSVLNEKLEKFNSNLTEWENMQLNGYDRIWDCGSLKYELVF